MRKRRAGEIKGLQGGSCKINITGGAAVNEIIADGGGVRGNTPTYI